jgi:hypothetical protein
MKRVNDYSTQPDIAHTLSHWNESGIAVTAFLFDPWMNRRSLNEVLAQEFNRRFG